MEQTEIAKLLTSFGFKGLVLTDLDGALFTYKFEDYKHDTLVKNFGSPSLAASGKVAIFVVPSYGKLGVSPGSHRVRLSYTGSHTKQEVNDSHLAKGDIPKEISVLYERAKSSPAYRLRLVNELWEFFNETKFARRMKKPKFLMSEVPKGVKLGKNTRGYYMPKLTPPVEGTLWISTRLFNASAHFFNEVMLHEMCHQAVWCLDREIDKTDGGHGPLWQAWMRKVGLNPRRYDPTENSVYEDDATKAVKDEKLAQTYGPRAPVAEIKKLKPSKEVPLGKAFFMYEGRLFDGAFTRRGAKYEFRGVNIKGKKPITLIFKGKPTNGIYTE